MILYYYVIGEYTPMVNKIINEIHKLIIFKNLSVGMYSLTFAHNTFTSAKVFSFYIFTPLKFRKLN